MATEYLMKVGKNVSKDVHDWLDTEKAPSWVRIGVREPVSIYGYEPGVEVLLYRINDRGVLMGGENREDIPREFIPWHNVAYMCDGTSLAKAKSK